MNSSTSIKDVILAHYKLYPSMGIEDYIKLLYQSAFGCGHILNEYAFNTLKDEYNQFDHQVNETNYIDIGNGYSRLDLSHTNMSVDEIFLLMKNANKKDENAHMMFSDCLEELLNLIEENYIPLDYANSKAYIEQYLKDGIFIPSHSQIYKQLYKPSYRVIKR